MAEIVEVFDDIKRTVGDKGFYMLAAGAAAFGLYNLIKGSQEDTADMASTRIVTSVASYPDAVTNANVIIDTIQNSIDYSEGLILDAIQGSDDELKEYLENNFEQTNNYINDGLESQKKLMEENFDDLKGGIDEIKENNSRPTYIYTGGGSSGSTTTPKTDTTNKASTGTTSKTQSSVKNTTEYYTYKTAKGMNTSTSIVDALKVSTGNYDSKQTAATLKKVAAANGISNYTGTYSQNVSLLSKMKQGKLKKA